MTTNKLAPVEPTEIADWTHELERSGLTPARLIIRDLCEQDEPQGDDTLRVNADDLERRINVALIAATPTVQGISEASKLPAEQMRRFDDMPYAAPTVQASCEGGCRNGEAAQPCFWMVAGGDGTRVPFFDKRPGGFDNRKNTQVIPLFASAPDSEKEIAPPIHGDTLAFITRADITPAEALQFYADQKFFDIVGGHARIIENGAVASNALKHMSLDRLELKGDTELAELRATIAQQAEELSRCEAIINGMSAKLSAAQERELKQGNEIELSHSIIAGNTRLIETQEEQIKQQAAQLQGAEVAISEAGEVIVSRNAENMALQKEVAQQAERIKELAAKEFDWAKANARETDKLAAAQARIAELEEQRQTLIAANVELSRERKNAERESASKDALIEQLRLIFCSLNNRGGFGYLAHELFDKALAAIERHQGGQS